MEAQCSKEGLERKISAIFNEFSAAITSNQKLWFSRHPTSIYQKILRKEVSFSGLWDKGRRKREKRKYIPVVKASDEKSPVTLLAVLPLLHPQILWGGKGDGLITLPCP